MSYPWQHLNPKDQVKIRLERSISNQDVHVLTTLYQPLIGSTSYALYMALTSSITTVTEWSEEYALSTFLARLDCGIPDFYQARVRLEALGLLKVFRSKQDKDMYVYDVRPPMSAADFFQDNVMRLLLFEKVGERVYKSLREQFVSKRASLNEYEEITQSFLDVYHFDIQKHNRFAQLGSEAPLQEDHSRLPKESIVEESAFDWKFFVEGLNRHFIKVQSMNQEIKELVYTFHTVYGIDEIQMQRFILEATDVESGNVEKNKFIHIVHRAFHKNQPEGVRMTDKVGSTIEQQNEKSTLRRNTLKQKGFSKEEIEIIEHAEDVTPNEYLESIKEQKGGFVTSNEQWVLKELVEKSPLHSPVINILINYILIIKEAAVLEKSLAIKIANDWAQNNVRSPEEAMEKVKQLYSEAQARKKSSQYTRSSKRSWTAKSNGRKETLPKWANEPQATETDERISAEEEQAFKEKLQKIRARKGGNN